MKIKSLMLGLALATGAAAQNSILGTTGTFNAAGAAPDSQQKQGAMRATQGAAEESQASADRIRLEREDIRLETLPESHSAQQTVAEVKAAADMESQNKAAEPQLAEARHQVRIEHLKILAIKAKEKHPDFEETISHLNLPTSQAMLEAILDSELGAEILYWLGKHPAECKLIGDLQPLSAVREIGRIEGTIAPLAP